MFEVIKKKKDTVTVEMDIKTFEWICEETNENISEYEFVFETPISAKNLVK